MTAARWSRTLRPASAGSFAPPHPCERLTGVGRDSVEPLQRGILPPEPSDDRGDPGSQSQIREWHGPQSEQHQRQREPDESRHDQKDGHHTPRLHRHPSARPSPEQQPVNRRRPQHGQHPWQSGPLRQPQQRDPIQHRLPDEQPPIARQSRGHRRQPTRRIQNQQDQQKAQRGSDRQHRQLAQTTCRILNLRVDPALEPDHPSQQTSPEQSQDRASCQPPATPAVQPSSFHSLPHRQQDCRHRQRRNQPALPRNRGSQPLPGSGNRTDENNCQINPDCRHPPTIEPTPDLAKSIQPASWSPRAG